MSRELCLILSDVGCRSFNSFSVDESLFSDLLTSFLVAKIYAHLLSQAPES